MTNETPPPPQNPYAPPAPQNPHEPPSNPYAPPSNPYAPPSARLVADGTPDDAEAIRRELLQHEARLRSIGLLYLLGGGFYLLIAAFGVVGLLTSLVDGDTADLGFGLIGVAALGTFGAGFVWIGLGLRRLHEKVRLATTILAVLGLLGFPLGTLISAYILWALHGDKGKRVMTPEYRAVVVATPHIRYRTSWLVWLVLALLVLGGVVAIVSLL